MSLTASTLETAGTRRDEIAPRVARSQTRDSILWVAAAVLLLVGGVLLPYDVAIARFFRDQVDPRLIGSFLENVEPFGHAAGVLLIAVTVFVLDPRARSHVMRIAVAAAASGVGCTLLKAVVGRVRPRHLDLEKCDMWTSFGGWRHFSLVHSSGQSFPSAHTTTAFALAVVLGAAYPRGRSWFLVLAALVALERVQTSSHFASDAFAGAALGLVCGAATVRWLRCDARPDGAALP